MVFVLIRSLILEDVKYAVLRRPRITHRKVRKDFGV